MPAIYARAPCGRPQRRESLAAPAGASSSALDSMHSGGRKEDGDEATLRVLHQYAPSPQPLRPSGVPAHTGFDSSTLIATDIMLMGQITVSWLPDSIG